MAEPITLDGAHLTPEMLMEVARGHRRVRLGTAARRRMERSRREVLRAVEEGRPVYGVTTGFGRLSDRLISREDAKTLQRNLIRSHASGVGPLLPPDLVRALLLVRANGLCRGFSGVRPEVVITLLGMLNRDVTPAIPLQGSVGASGDLAPLAHAALAMLGEGEVLAEGGRTKPGAAALRDAGIPPLVPQEKEGIALLNGTCLMTAYLALLEQDGERLLRAAEMVAGLSFDVLQGNVGALDPRLHGARNLPEQEDVAAFLRGWLRGSALVRPARDYQGQDPYVLRCIPQVLGASRVGLGWARRVLEGELNAASDNPLIFGSDFVSGGNFHGQPLALALETLALALSYVGSFSERRSARLVDSDLSRGLAPFLSRTPGLSSGYMIPQYVAAALVAENAALAHPVSAYSLPTSANQEDFNSMGAGAGAKGERILENLWRILAVELLLGCAGLEERRPAHGGVGTESLYREVRRRVPPLEADRPPAPDLETLARLLREGPLLEKVAREVSREGSGTSKGMRRKGSSGKGPASGRSRFP